MNLDSDMDLDLAAPLDRPRLVRSRNGRLIEPLTPRVIAQPEPMTRRTKILAIGGGVVAFGLLAALFMLTQGHVGTVDRKESKTGAAGYVIKEVRGPGLAVRRTGPKIP